MCPPHFSEGGGGQRNVCAPPLSDPEFRDVPPPHILSRSYTPLLMLFQRYEHPPGADPGFLKGGGVQIRSTNKKGWGQTGVQLWAQC